MIQQYRVRRAAFAATAAATLVAGAVAPAQSSEIQRAYVAHTVSCIGLFFSDIDAHEAQCLPNNNATPVVEMTKGGPTIAPPVPPVIPPVDENCYPGIAGPCVPV